MTIIQGLWIGPRLSTMEHMSMKSFIDNGHEYHLYCYEEIENVPEGVIIKDGNEILPKEMIFSYKVGAGKGSFSAFSNFFRYKLVLEKGGYWVDTDTICLKHWDFEEPYVFSSEWYAGKIHCNAGIIKCPAGSEVMQRNWDVCQSKDPNKIAWSEIGPRLVKASVEKLGLEEYIKKPETFCPIGFERWFDVLNPNTKIEFDDDVYAIHLWNEMWRRGGRDKDAKYHPDCYYEQLKKRFGVE